MPCPAHHGDQEHIVHMAGGSPDGAGGVYFARLDVEGEREHGKLVLEE